MTDLYLTVSQQEAVRLLTEEIVNGSITGELIDEYSYSLEGDKAITVLIFQKHFFRAENRLTLTVVIDNVNGKTRLHGVGGGGGKGIFKFDCGAADKFEESIYDAFYKYIMKE